MADTLNCLLNNHYFEKGNIKSNNNNQNDNKSAKQRVLVTKWMKVRLRFPSQHQTQQRFKHIPLSPPWWLSFSNPFKFNQTITLTVTWSCLLNRLPSSSSQQSFNSWVLPECKGWAVTSVLLTTVRQSVSKYCGLWVKRNCYVFIYFEKYNS